MSTINAPKNHVSPSVHEANITSLPGYSDDTKAYVAGSVNLLKGSQLAIEKVIEARQKVNLDPSRTAQAKVLVVADVADKYNKQLQVGYEKEADNLLKRIAHKEGELTKPVEEYAGIGTVASEIRSHLKSLNQHERRDFISAALERGDEKSIKSILGAPSYLSGLSDVEHAGYLKQYHQITNPAVTAQIDLMQGALGKLKQAHKAIRKQFDEAVGVSAMDIQKLRSANSSAEEALVIKNLLGGEA